MDAATWDETQTETKKIKHMKVLNVLATLGYIVLIVLIWDATFNRSRIIAWMLAG